MSPRAAIALTLALCGCSFIPGTVAHDEAEGRRLLTPVLFDASSARFEGVTRTVATSDNGARGDVICGKVNGRNQLGAYAGFHRFVVVPGENFAAVSPDAGPGASNHDRAAQEAFDGLWPVCSGGRQT